MKPSVNHGWYARTIRRAVERSEAGRRARAVACPKCGAKVGEFCRWTLPGWGPGIAPNECSARFAIAPEMEGAR